MSPFAKLLREHRLQRGLRQKDLAELIGFEQCYVSALELGFKGPPHQDFVSKCIEVFELNDEEQAELGEAVAASQRKIAVPSEAPTDIYWLCHRLRQQIDHLHPLQVELINTALSLPVKFDLKQSGQATRLRRRSIKPTIQEGQK